jgi:hypothetical protein
VNAGTAAIIDSIFSGNESGKDGLGTAIYEALGGLLDLDDNTVISRNGVPIFEEV